MPTTPDTESDARRLRHIDISLVPESRFPVPQSDGYSLYGAFLDRLSAVDETTSTHVHDASLGGLRVSALRGTFGESDRRHHKTVLPEQTYRLSLGVTDPAATDVFQALVRALVLDDDRVELTNGTLHVQEFESTNTTHADLLEQASEYRNPTIEMEFRSPTCIEETNEVTTMFPHRVSVFNSVLGKWNKTSPEELQFDLDRDAIAGSVIEKPNARAYRTHSVLVNRVTNENGENRNIFRQGFSGECEYAFKDATSSVQNAVTSLALFAEFGGVGSAVSRGCGDVNVEVSDR